MSNTQHTPTPWFVMHGTDIMHGDKAIRHAAADKIWADGGEQACANAAFIVRACNAHDELVAALQAAMLAHELTVPVNARFALETNCAPKWYRDARAALAKVQK